MWYPKKKDKSNWFNFLFFWFLNNIFVSISEYQFHHIKNESIGLFRQCNPKQLLTKACYVSDTTLGTLHMLCNHPMFIIPFEGNGNPLQYSCLENSMDRGAWQATVRGIAKSWTWLSIQDEVGDINSVPPEGKWPQYYRKD